ncbi:MAG: Fic family protein [Candidatus Binatia bacterium]
MHNQNWEPISGPVAQDIRFLNYATQKNVLAALVKFLLAKPKSQRDRSFPMPDENALHELHRAGTLFLLAEPGCYREIDVHVAKAGAITHQPPPWQDVERLMQQFFRTLASLWKTGDALDIAAYALWRIGWIHPFTDGNGRTASAFSYACLCVKLGALLPGRETVIDQMMAEPGRCERVLRAADRRFAKSNGKTDLRAVKKYLDDLLLRQIQTAEAETG